MSALNALIAAVPPVIVRIVQEPSRTPWFASAEWWTAITTALLVVVGAFGLKSLGLAARALKVETDPVVVVEEVPQETILEKEPSFDAAFDLYSDGNFTQLRETPNGQSLRGRFKTASVEDLTQTIVLRVRNVGRSPVINLNLEMAAAVVGNANPIRMPISAITANGDAFVLVRNMTPFKVFLKAARYSLHQPDDRPRVGYAARAAFALKLHRLIDVRHTPVIAKLFRWRQGRRYELYVFCPKQIILLPRPPTKNPQG